MFQTKTGPKLSIPTVKTGRKSLSLSCARGGHWRVAITFAMSFTASNTSPIFLNTSPTKQPKFLPKFVPCILCRNVFIAFVNI